MKITSGVKLRSIIIYVAIILAISLLVIFHVTVHTDINDSKEKAKHLIRSKGLSSSSLRGIDMNSSDSVDVSVDVTVDNSTISTIPPSIIEVERKQSQHPVPWAVPLETIPSNDSSIVFVIPDIHPHPSYQDTIPTLSPSFAPTNYIEELRIIPTISPTNLLIPTSKPTDDSSTNLLMYRYDIDITNPFNKIPFLYTRKLYINSMKAIREYAASYSSVDLNTPNDKLISSFYQSAATGTDCKYTSLSEKSISLISSIKTLLYETNASIFYEYSNRNLNNSYSLMLSTAYSNTTSVFIKTDLSRIIDGDSIDDIFPDDSLQRSLPSSIDDTLIVPANEYHQCESYARPNNLFVGSSISFKSSESSSKYHSKPKKLNCIQFIQDLNQLVADKLPLEFEEYLGRVLCRCSNTILPKDLPSNSYFSYWTSVSSLVDSANAAASLIFGNNECGLSVDTTTRYTLLLKLRTYSFSLVTRANTSSPIDELNLLDLSTMDLDEISLQQVYSSLIEYSYLSSLFSPSTPTTSPSSIVNPYEFPLTGDTDTATVSKHVYYDDKFFDFDSSPENIYKMLSSYEILGSEIVEYGSDVSRIHSHSTSNQHLSHAQEDTLTSSSAVLPILSPTQMPLISPNDTNTNTTSSSLATPPPSNSTFFSSFARRLTSSSSVSSLSSTEVVDFSSSWLIPMETLQLFPATESLGSWESLDNSNKYRNVSMSLKATPENAFGKVNTFKDSASRHQLRSLQIREYECYSRWLEVLRSDVMGHEIILNSKTKLVYVFGRYTTLLSIKLSQRFLKHSKDVKDDTPLVITLSTDESSIQTHLKLIQSRKLVNNFLCHAKISSLQAAALLGAPDKANLAIFQVDIILQIFLERIAKIPHSIESKGYPETILATQCQSIAIEELLLAYISSSYVSYIEMPSPAILKTLLYSQLKLKNIQCYRYLLNRYNSSSQALLESIISQLFINSQVHIRSIDDHLPNSNLLVSQIFSVSISPRDPLKELGYGISIYTLLHLGIVNELKVKLIQLYLQLPLWLLEMTSQEKGADEVLPWRVFVRVIRSLISLEYVSSNTSPQLTFGISSGRENILLEAKKANIFTSLLMKELKSHSAEVNIGKFSFVEHNSGYGFLSTKIAKTFPNATVVSIEVDESKAKHHFDMLEDLDIQNNAICVKGENDLIVFKNIYESPELFRFQVMMNGMLESFFSSYTNPTISKKTASSYSKTIVISYLPTNSEQNLLDWGESIGEMLSSALTSFISIPLASQVSLVHQVFFGGLGGNTEILASSTGPYYALRDVFPNSFIKEEEEEFKQSKQDISLSHKVYQVSNHPSKEFEDFEELFLLKYAKVGLGGSTQVSITPMYHEVNHKVYRVPLVRCDLVNMTRLVHHHYDYAKDGHTRTYSMHVSIDANETQYIRYLLNQRYHTEKLQDLSNLHAMFSPLHNGVILSIDSSNSSSFSMDKFDPIILPSGYHPNQHELVKVGINRDKDDWFIPYTTIYGITLITTLRLGLIPSQVERFYESFIHLPLYEDMAPWNIVLMGPSVDYIDYDTKDITFDLDLPKAYQIMSVLMNYKRTVEDFHKCGSKASTVYNLPYVSECVGKTIESIKCDGLKLPVPCGDGQCHSDYISCLRAVTDMAMKLANEAFGNEVNIQSFISNKDSPSNEDLNSISLGDVSQSLGDQKLVWTFTEEGIRRRKDEHLKR